jgi:hypothetical protein
MKQARLKTDFSKLSDSDLEIKAQAVVSAMTDNPFFSTPVPSLITVSAAITSYSTALSKAQTRDKAEIANKNFMRTELEKTLGLLAGWVSFTAGGLENVLVSSGFDLAKTASNLPPIGVPDNFSVLNGVNEGEVVSSVDRVIGAKSYIHEYTADPLTPGSEWTQEFTTIRKRTIANLVPGQKYWFRVAAIGPRNQITYTNAQLRMVA